jgi:hypothetical protein
MPTFEPNAADRLSDEQLADIATRLDVQQAVHASVSFDPQFAQLLTDAVALYKHSKDLSIELDVKGKF